MKQFTKLVLMKLSESGWEKEFTNYEDLLQELRWYICEDCSNEVMVDCQHYGNYGAEHIVNEYLASTCGCEFWVEEVQE